MAHLLPKYPYKDIRILEAFSSMVRDTFPVMKEKFNRNQTTITKHAVVLIISHYFCSLNCHQRYKSTII